MISLKYYQIVETGTWWVEVVETTLETCTDVAYSEQDLWDLYNGGKEFAWYHTITKSDVTFYRNHIVFVEQLLTTIISKMKDVKELSDDILPEIFLGTGLLDKLILLLRVEGVSYSPTRGLFIKYKPRKRKVLHNGQALRRSRVLLIEELLERINQKFGSQLQQSGNVGKQAEEGVIRLGKLLGFTFDDIDTGEFIKGTNWYKLSSEEEVHTYEALRKWFDSVGPDVPISVVNKLTVDVLP